MIGHADANDIKCETAIGDNEDGQDNMTELAKYPVTLIVAGSFFVGLIFGFVAGIIIGMILA